MARKKKQETEIVQPLGDKGVSRVKSKLMVQKSIPLLSLWRSKMTLAEFKILDTYLSRIDSHKPSKRTVIFERGELEKLLGVEKISMPVLKQRLRNLMTPIDIEDDEEGKRFTTITLFEEASADQDKYEQWKIKMTCTSAAMKYVFDIEHLGYLRYKLRCITSITSRYTYIMFIYLEANRFRKSWDIPLDELKELLNCDQEKTYKEFKRFNDLILKKVQQELHAKTECKYDYEPIKSGRRVTKIRFTVDTLPKMAAVENPDQITIEDLLESQRTDIWYGVVKEWKLGEEEYQELRSLLSTVPRPKMPDMGYGIEINTYHYLDLKVKEIERRSKAKTINSKYAYLVKMIKQDIG